MRTNQEYEDYFINLIGAIGIKPPDPSKYVQSAIEAGLKQFWGAKPWSFKMDIYTINITSSADYYPLPDDFDSVVSIREETTTYGFKLIRVSKQRFDEMIPKQSATAGEDALIYTIFTVLGKPVISIYRQPSSVNLYMAYMKTTPNNVSGIPDKFQSGLESAIACHVFLPGYDQRLKAYQEFRAEVRRLEVQDKDGVLDEIDMLIETSTPNRTHLRWWEY